MTSSKLTLRNAVKQNYIYYQSKHRTTGCKATHMIGIPMIVLSFLILPFHPRKAVALNAGGWALQLIGHYFFEHNKPVFLEVRDPIVAISALHFTFIEWKRFFSGEKI